MTAYDRYSRARRIAERGSWAFAAIALCWHVALALTNPNELAWIRHDPSFGLFLPFGGYFLVRLSGYLVAELGWAWDSFPSEVRAQKQRALRLMFGTTALLSVLIIANVPADLTRATILPDYMYSDPAVRNEASLLRLDARALSKNADSWPDLSLSDAIGSNEPCESLYKKHQPVRIAGKKQEEWEISPETVEEVKKVFLRACAFGREHRLTTIGNIGKRPFGWMPAVNAFLNALVFLPIALCIGAFAATSNMRGEMNPKQRKRTTLLVVALLIVGLLWLPVRLYSETYINFLAPQPFSLDGSGYVVFTAVVATIILVSVLVLLWLVTDFGSEWVIKMWVGAITTMSTLLVTVEPVRYGAIHVVSTMGWPMFGISAATSALLGHALIRSFANALRQAGWGDDGSNSPPPAAPA